MPRIVTLLVSIPQSGFGAFELAALVANQSIYVLFQSLSRDSGRLNVVTIHHLVVNDAVSIPQSGFGAFEPAPTATRDASASRFQSLSRDSGRLNICLPEFLQCSICSFNPSVGIRGV